MPEKTKLNAEDVYAKVEQDKQSELAKLTSTPDWLLTELIKSGEFGTEEDEIKENLAKEGLSFENIDIAELIAKEVEKAEENEILPNPLEIFEQDEKNYNNLITKEYNLGNLDTYRGDSFTIRGKPSEQSKPQENEDEDIEKDEDSESEKTVRTASSDKTTVIKAYPHQEFKSYMRWTALHPESRQGKFSAKASPDPETAIMMYNGRYLVALGSAYADEVGQEIDIVMESGEIIPAVIGDFKANEHTDKYNSTHLWDGSVVEFVVSSNEEAAKVTNYSGSYNNIFPGLVKEFRK